MPAPAASPPHRRGTEKTAVNLPTERSVIAVDPSEAVRSADIVPVLRQYFEIVEAPVS